MSEQVIKNGSVFIGGYDMSGQHNQVEISLGAEMLDKTVFQSSFMKRLAGLSDVSVSHSGFFGTTDTDKEVYDRVGSTKQTATVTPEIGNAGARAFFMDGVWSEYTLGGSIGDVLSFSGACAGAGPLIRGKINVNEATTAAGQSTSVESLATTSSGETLAAAVHVTAHTGAVFTVDVVADSSSGFGISPTTMLSISATGINGYFDSTMASTSDTYYRTEWSSTGTFTATIVGAIGKYKSE